MRISSIGESGLIKRIKGMIRLDRSVIVGPGDDCAVLAFDKKSYQLASCDMLVENVDFTKKDDPRLIGRKALAVSISDIAACGGLPTHALVSFGFPRNTPSKTVLGIVKGITRFAASYGINLIGGDLSRAAQIVINTSIFGIVEKKCLALRSGACKGDIIFVTGSLGGSIRGRHLTFTPRLQEARYLVKNFKINSMIDISDGLAQDLGHITQGSRVGAVINEELIPLSGDARNIKEAFYMGEDFELLFTLSPDEARRLVSSTEARFYAIGKIIDEKKGIRVVKNNKERILKEGGWRHF